MNPSVTSIDIFLDLEEELRIIVSLYDRELKLDILWNEREFILNLTRNEGSAV